MNKLFESINNERILYVVWKDLHKVDDFFEGNAELDLLVNFKEKQKFESIILSYGFIPLLVVESLRKDKIEHYIKYEQGKYEEAIELFDLALEIHKQFSDVQYYKALSLGEIGRKEEARELYKIARVNGKQGYSFNEDNAIYERYPYQVRWH